MWVNYWRANVRLAKVRAETPSMQSRFQQEPGETERRYRPETVQKAAALAAKLQEEQRGTLTQSEVDQMAAEIGIEPALMRQALAVVAQSEGTQVSQARRATALPLLFACAWSGGFLLILFLFLLRVRSLPPQATVAVGAPVEAGQLVSGTLVQNGSFEAGAGGTEASQKLVRGTRSLPGWTVDHREVYWLSGASPGGGHAIRLGEYGSIRQVFKTVPNQLYRVSFSLSGQPGAVNRLHRVMVEVGNVSTVPSVFTPAGAALGSTWEHPSFEFVAQEAGTLLHLSAGPKDDVGSGSPIIDDVKIEAVPVGNQ